MDVTIKAAEGAGADVYRWLAADPPVRSFGASAVPAGREPGDGTMGTGFDLLNLLVPNAIALASLLVSLAAFRDQRRATTGTPPAITVSSGVTVVMVTSTADAQALAAQLLQAAPAVPAPGSPPPPAWPVAPVVPPRPTVPPTGAGEPGARGGSGG